MNLSITKFARGFSSPSSGFRSSPLGRLVLPVCALLVSWAVTPLAHAAAPNGIYQYTSGSGEIKFAGQPFELSKTLLRKIGAVKNGSVTIKNGKLTLDREAARKIIQEIVEVTPEIAVKGPSSITFNKSGISYVAKAPKPVVVNLSADVSGEDLEGVLRSRFDAKVTGRKLTINVKFDGIIGFAGSVNQQEIEGSATIVCTR
ncbi:MAG: hypothetical protein V4689_20090 [Verrucomicrobiota bacterium]